MFQISTDNINHSHYNYSHSISCQDSELPKGENKAQIQSTS